MILNFENVSLLGITQQDIKFETDFTFKRSYEYSITGFLLDLANDEGVKNILNDGDNFTKVPSSTDFTKGSSALNLNEIKINGESQGIGYISNIEIEGKNIQLATYIATVVIFKNGDANSIDLIQNENSKLSLSLAGLTDQDFQYLRDIEENFNFSIGSSDQINISHEVNCSFGYQESMIPKNNKIWSNSFIQTVKLSSLKNKGKGSIKVASGQTAAFQKSLSAGDYTLIFDYLGSSSGQAEISFTGSSDTITLTDPKYSYKLNFNVPSSSSVSIRLKASTSSASYFDNIELHKKEDMPINKSRALARFLIDNAPNYSLISGLEGEYKKLNLNKNNEETESFDEEQLSYSITNNTNYQKADGESYSYLVKSTFNYGDDGYIQIGEQIKVEILEQKTQAKLKQAIDNEVSKSYDRVKDLIDPNSPDIGYKDYFRLNCTGIGFSGAVGPGFTPSIPQDLVDSEFFIKPILISTNVDEKEGVAEIKITYSDNQKFYSDGVNFLSHQYSLEIEDREGKNNVIISGAISSFGELLSERISSVQSGLSTFLSDSYIQNLLNTKKDELGITSTTVSDYERYIFWPSNSDLKTEYFTNVYPKEDLSAEEYGKAHWFSAGQAAGRTLPTRNIFNKVNESITIDESIGSATYTITYSDSLSLTDYDSTASNIIKSFDISVNESEETEIFSEFTLNCENWAQDLGQLYNPKTTVVEAEIYGYLGQDFHTLFAASSRILKSKGLNLGEASENPSASVVNASTSDNYLVDQSISYDQKQNRLTYRRGTINLGECDTATRVDPKYGFDNWQANYPASNLVLHAYDPENFTFNPVDEFPYTPFPEYPITPTPDPVITEEICLAYSVCLGSSYSYNIVPHDHSIAGINSIDLIYTDLVFFDSSKPQGEQCINVLYLPQENCPSTSTQDSNFGSGFSVSSFGCENSLCGFPVPTPTGQSTEDPGPLKNLKLLFNDGARKGEKFYFEEPFGIHDVNLQKENNNSFYGEIKNQKFLEENQEKVQQKIYLPKNWSGRIKDLIGEIGEYELLYGKPCPSTVLGGEQQMNNSHLGINLCSCQSDVDENISRWEYLTIYLPKANVDLIRDELKKPSHIIEIDVPDFWDKTIGEIMPDGELIAVQKYYGPIIFNINNNLNPEDYLVLGEEDNESHPNFKSKNKFICGRKVYFRIDDESKYKKRNIHKYELDFIKNKKHGVGTIDEWLQTKSSINDIDITKHKTYKVLGWLNCKNEKIFNKNKIKQNTTVEHCKTWFKCGKLDSSQDCSNFIQASAIYIEVEDRESYNCEDYDIKDCVIY